MKRPKEFRAILLVGNGAETTVVTQCCSRHRIETRVVTGPQTALELCRTGPPDLAIVGDELDTMSGVQFLRVLVRLAWTTSTILVTNENEDAVHEKAKGLGILGHIKDLEDEEGLGELLKRVLTMITSAHAAR